MAPSLTLEPREKLLKECLADCAQTVRPLEIRFAGGWVRDKLLGHQSNDIDAALSSLSGKDFGQAFLQFYEKHGAKYKDEAALMGIDHTELHKIVLVEEDADKSKHLAVAKMKLFGLEVDLVNLRTEVYASHSRTPVIQMGTAEEDAMRRDATINALFYNIHTEEVEDLTGKGLQDLQDKVMRTPLDPLQTFNDDPLRVLRLIRFASKLGFQIDPAAQEAMKDPSIHGALKSKISRERVRAEVVKALEGPGPALALNYIQQFGLYSSCFADPSDTKPPSPEGLPQIYTLLADILKDAHLAHSLQLDQSPAYLPWLFAAYIPYISHPAEHGVQAIKAGLKATVREAKLLASSIANRPEISHLVSTTTFQPANPPISRGHIAMSLRHWGSNWGHQMLFSLLHDLQTPYPSSSPSPSPTTISSYHAFLHHLEQLDLAGNTALEARPLLDGRKITEILARDKAGPGNKMAADLVLEWQFDHPEGEAGDCVRMVEGRREEILTWEAGREKKGGRGKK